MDCCVNAAGLRAYLFASHNAMRLPSADVAALGAHLGEPGLAAELGAALAAPPINTEDPITSEVPEPPLFFSGAHRFSAAHLAAYFRSEGKSTNPLTNMELHPDELRALGAIVGDGTLPATVALQKQAAATVREYEAVVRMLANDFTLAFDSALDEIRAGRIETALAAYNTYSFGFQFEYGALAAEEALTEAAAALFDASPSVMSQAICACRRAIDEGIPPADRDAFKHELHVLRVMLGALHAAYFNVVEVVDVEVEGAGAGAAAGGGIALRHVPVLMAYDDRIERYSAIRYYMMGSGGGDDV